MSASKEIKSVYLEDFQSHQKTKIELAPAGGLAVIVGPTDSGKTAIVRGLRLLFYNTPQGLEYIRVGRNMATVAVEMGDSTKVARERSKSVNRYRVTKPGGSPQVFEGFGVSVPLEVQDATGVRTVTVGESVEIALNLSEQLDGPFLGKTVSGPAKAKILGALAGTEEVDAAQQAVGLDLHRAGQDESRIADEIKALDARITEYDYLPRLADQIFELENLLTSVKALQSRLHALESCVDHLVHIGGERGRLFDVLAKWGGLPQAISHVEYAEGALARMRALSGYKASLSSVWAQTAEWLNRLERWAGLDDGVTAYNEAYLAASRQELLINLRRDLLVTLEGKAKCEWVLMRWEGLPEAEELASRVDSARERAATLFRLMYELDRARARAEDAQETLMRWQGLDNTQSAISTIPTLQNRLRALCALNQAAIEVRGGRVVAEQHLSMHTKALGDAQSLYADTLIKLGTCPLCGSAVDPASISLHIKEVA